MLQILLIRTRHGARAGPLGKDDAIPFPLLHLPLLLLHLRHALRIPLTIQRRDLEPRKSVLEELAQLREQLGVGPVGAGVVVDDEFVVSWVLGWVVVGGPAVDVVRWVRFRVVWESAFAVAVVGFEVLVRLVRVLEPADEEFAGEGDVEVYVAVHGVLGQHVDAEFLAGLGEAEERVEGEDVGEDAAALVEVDEVEKFDGHVVGWVGGETAVESAAVEIVDACVLMVEGFGKEKPTESFGREHGFDKRFELDVAMVEVYGYGSGKLKLVGLEAVRCQ